MADESLLARNAREVHDDHIPRLIALAEDRCFSREAALAAGVSEREIAGLLARKIIAAVFAGIYVIGRPVITQREFLRASVLHAGPTACVSHRSGLEIRSLVWVRSGQATVTTTRRGVVKEVRTLVPLTDGGFGLLRVVESSAGQPLLTETVDGFDTTPLPRTLVDAAGREGAGLLKAAWDKAELRALLDADAIEREIQAHPRAGVRAVRERLKASRPVTRPGDDIRSRSGELAFLKLIENSEILPRPEINVPMEIGGRPYVADFLYRFIGLIFETDGGQHDLPGHQLSDRQRDAQFFVAGFDVVRIGNDEMRDDPAGTLATAEAAYLRQLKRAA